MGDRRFADAYARIVQADDRAAAIARLDDAEVVFALAHASREGNPYLANVLATESLNRLRHRAAWGAAVGVGAAAGAILVLAVIFALVLYPAEFRNEVFLAAAASCILAAALLSAWFFRWRLRHPPHRIA